MIRVVGGFARKWAVDVSKIRLKRTIMEIKWASQMEDNYSTKSISMLYEKSEAHH
jgi:hypothetical protein